VLDELLKTEETYNNDLKVLCEMQKDCPIDAEAKKELFCNVEDLATLHERVFVEFKKEAGKEQSNQNWGVCFRQFVGEFQSLYQIYAKNQKKLRIVKMRLAKEEKFKVWSKEQADKRQDLNGFLIKPVQRICKYPLLMRELLKVYELLELTNFEEAKNELEEAMEEMSDVLNEANEFMATLRSPRK
jgi:cell division control protein 24